jgi:hypothetical protein
VRARSAETVYHREMSEIHRLAAFGLGFAFVSFAEPVHRTAMFWGDHGHRMVGSAAAAKLPVAMPAFFRKAAPQLSYLNPEPDRWRDRAESRLDPAMTGAYWSEHFVDLELVPPAAFLAENRYAYLDSIQAAGVKENPGMLNFQILELTQRLRVGFRLWRAAKTPQTRAFIEARIINDAGILGHYVADGSNPHHTTVHHDGWVGENPRGYTTERGFHSRFESIYVRTHMKLPEVLALMTAPVTVRSPVRDSVQSYLNRSHAELERLYQIDARARFDSNTTSPENRQFAAERLAAGAEMLRDLWWTAWTTSAHDSATARNP